MSRWKRAAVTLSFVLAAPGCSAANPITTQMSYAPSDGVRVQLSDDVSAENLMILTRGEDQEGHLLGAVVNRSTDPSTVTVTVELDGGSTYTFDLGPSENVNLTDEDLTPTRVDAPPGATLPGTVSASNAGSQDVDIPVLDGTIPPVRRVPREQQLKFGPATISTARITNARRRPGAMRRRPLRRRGSDRPRRRPCDARQPGGSVVVRDVTCLPDATRWSRAVPCRGSPRARPEGRRRAVAAGTWRPGAGSGSAPRRAASGGP
ncbi:hypothetical protein [Georgenia sp. SUBG003]|uniref:hypothetical protein n=1 Tax=Georgenia sp. SUBG003 TaxID=1497974 RepID=UPI003AB41AA0